MPRINILSSEVYNRIAAGEVVENPQSVVKELIENSIDAGAKQIVVEIEEGGIRCIKVTDDGCGIDFEDMEKAFLPHATSKIKQADDLNYIYSLGFRGEALASIASVSSVKMISKTPEAAIGYCIQYDNGKKVDLGEHGCPDGTTVIVSDLFDKIPARKKFLSKPSQEEAKISGIIQRLILANYNIAFKYIASGKLVYLSDGSGMESAIYAIYGAEFLENLLHVSHIMPGISIKGYIGKPSFTKHNRSFQTLIINGRYVVNQEIVFLMYHCYKEYLMSRQFPVYVLYIDLPPDMLDANVHPNKSDVRFADFAAIRRNLIGTVKNVLRAGALTPGVAAMKADILEPETNGLRIIPHNIVPEDVVGQVASTLDADPMENFQKHSQMQLHNHSNREHAGGDKKYFSQSERFHILQEQPHRARTADASFFDTATAASDTPDWDSIRGVDKDPATRYFDTQTAMPLKQSYKLIGKLFNTYLILEEGQQIFLIDQHAAHERLIYDRLLTQYDAGDVLVQDLLLPYIFDCTHEDSELLSGILEQLGTLGFQINRLSGRSFSLNAVPLCCAGMNNQLFIIAFFDNLQDKKWKNSDFLKDFIAKCACKAAVKGNNDLSENEMDSLLEQMKEMDALFCPHGRPVMIKLTKHEIEKWFKRIV